MGDRCERFDFPGSHSHFAGGRFDFHGGRFDLVTELRQALLSYQQQQSADALTNPTTSYYSRYGKIKDSHSKSVIPTLHVKWCP